MSKYEENPNYISFQTFSVMVQKALLKILVHRKWFFAQEYAVITNSDIVEIWINEQDSIVLTPVRGLIPLLDVLSSHYSSLVVMGFTPLLIL